MITTTHVLVAGALLTRRDAPRRQNILAFVGGFVPDLSVFIMVAYSAITGVGRGNMWRSPDGLYWQEPWQSFSAISNSIPLYALLILSGWLLAMNVPLYRHYWRLISIFAAGALLHVVMDFPVHTDDAHVHFWPITDWRFYSPVSYYQSANYGEIVSAIELVVGVGLAALLMWRFRAVWARVFIVALLVPYFISLGFIFRTFLS
ncbi:hypothetical protein [Maritalea mediterranea]|uniref:Cobalamin biosynthesis protein CobQ n=1 Tax=Maritalea mediterranea TaxID=2909667 RepID=A0ABS9E876_9HYPH|nr:hypothetical protein [Maritalea mediterranea]MCF4099047.1 hypothetical protein [Maritalea mediterranea]